MSLDPERLADALAHMGGGARLPLSNITRLSGGANMESWSFDWGDGGFVLRRAPSEEFMAGRSFGLDVEASIVRVARAAGVLAPEIVGELKPDDEMGSAYVMRRVEAEVNPALILANPPPSLLDDLARELAGIHKIDPSAVSGVFTLDAATGLAELKQRFADFGGDRPVLALAFKWCEDHLPPSGPPVLVHGDFRIGNVMASENGLAAVLDWELCHLGDYHEDLAYGCMNVWRFGHIDKPAFGCGDLESYFAAYERHSGKIVDRDRFRFWLVYRTLWWAIGCMGMAETWRTAVDRSIERPVIGRRTVENEADLLMLLEEDAPETQRLPVKLDETAGPRRQGEPSSAELLEALREWLEKDVKAKAQGREKFNAAVAMNALGMLIREVSNPVLYFDKPLCDDILAGRMTLANPGLLARLRKQVLQKLANDSPKYSALAKAREIWLA